MGKRDNKLVSAKKGAPRARGGRELPCTGLRDQEGLTQEEGAAWVQGRPGPLDLPGPNNAAAPGAPGTLPSKAFPSPGLTTPSRSPE